MANIFDQYEVWWVTGAQLLYGGETVKIVDGHSKEMVDGLNNSGILPIKVVYKGTANSSKEAEAVMKAANNEEKCVGVITWMHTFSPAKMWIHGLQQLRKPLLHLHTQYNAEIPWDTMDMDFMNLNQSAHGDREFGHILARMRKNHKTVFNPGFTTKKRGWGLGLALAKRIVEQYHKGHIFVARSIPYQATTFRIELPALG